MTNEEYFLQKLDRLKLWPERISTQEWIERNVDLDPAMSDMSGRVSLRLFPASRVFFKHLDHVRVRKCIVLKCAQSTFTENCIMYLERRIAENPITTMWVGANAVKTEEDAKKRIWPAIENCAAVRALCPKPEDRERWTRRLIMFDSMNLMIRGSESRMAMQGDPAGLIICDERREWKPGRIHLLRKRTRTKVHPLEISIGAAGKKDDELHADFKEGSQTYLYFTCPKCGHDQPWRFGRDKNVMFPEPREKGGVRWDESAKLENGLWDLKKVQESARYECEGCGHLFVDGEDKMELLAATHEHHLNPRALPENFSLYVNALVLPWAESTWGHIAVEFLNAQEAATVGDIEPLKTWVTETDGCPWEVRTSEQKDTLLRARMGDYKLGEMWMSPEHPKMLDPQTVLVLTFDRQLTEVKFVVRQWRKNGASRLVAYGAKPHYDDIAALCKELGVKPKGVGGDDGGINKSQFRQACLQYGWHILMGDDPENYVISDGDGKSHRQGWRLTQFDAGIGMQHGRHAMVPAYLWSNPWFKDKLYNMFIPGLGPLWEIPKDVSPDYMKEVLNHQWREKQMSDGRTEGYWHESKPCDFGDCECMQLVIADVAGLTRFLPQKA